MVKGVCLRYSRDVAEADDFLQDAFIKTFEKLNQYKGTGALGGWVRRIAVTTALESLRKQKIKVTELSIHIEQLIPDEEADVLFQKIDLDVLVSKIQRLPLGYRTVFNLYAIEGYTHQEIADDLSITVGTSKSQYSRARKLLIQMLESEELRTQKILNYVE
ncbi:hypothetical protein DNU06_12285 [Putridiphycobacter roseus]|uniref:RNA polymerase subunit sigma-70 n=2 Tax=Putridiphycobacter roseus TaxID=2219161 RepID=A0A2W1NEY6_9FLAO|nr:hypothetical protein DNU06_12285 [Putridiphycobacter roseus]